jgi:glucokinase
VDSLHLGIEIGGTKLQLAVGHGDGRIVGELRRLDVDVAAGAAGIRQQIEKQIASLLQAHPITNVGVGFGGPVDRRTGRIAVSHQIPGWSGFALAEWLSAKSERPVVVDNDANMAALGEAICGAGRRAETIFYVTLGSGVGGGCVSGGHVYHGTAPGESEIGHLRLDREGTILEQRCSGWAIDRRIRDLKQRGTPGVLCDRARTVDRGEASFLSEALAQNDPVADQLLDELSSDLAFGLSHVVHLFHPEMVILGGGLSAIGEPLRDAVAARLPHQVMAVFAPGPEIRLAKLEPLAVPTGCLVAAGRMRT